MIFSTDSEITLVVTSCGRFELLSGTLKSFDVFNTAPIREIFITEDCGKEEVRNCLPEHWREHTTFFINHPQLGQLSSIDLAYEHVQTPWIFHCEDDWAFYRPGFVEESLILLEAQPQALQVWLRSAAHDLAVHSPYISLGERQVVAGIPCYRMVSGKADWQGFSFNPGLRRLSDYQKHAPYCRFKGEKDISRIYAGEGRYSLILENDAVLHTGWGEHVVVPHERERKIKVKRRQRQKMIAVLILGTAIGIAIGSMF
jgi:hypothetical protein